MNSQLTRKLQRTLIVFPAIAMVVSVGCVSASGAQSDASPIAKKTTTTIKKKGSAAWPTALTVLARLKVAKNFTSGYLSSSFKYPVDADQNGCDTRAELLITESLSVVQKDAQGCFVVAGDWYSPYEGTTYEDPAEVQVDHLVSRKEAWMSGAHLWSASKRERFANDLTDPRPLMIVNGSQNASKKDRDPAAWMPPNVAYHCTYLANWVAVKSRWGLTVDLREKNFIKRRLTASCKTTTVAPWGTKQTSSTMKTTTVPSKGGSGFQTALSVLSSIPQEKEQQTGYSRSLFKHWSDLDRDGCSTREEVLIAESLTKAQVDAYGCKVIAGDWYSPYDNKRYSDPSDVDIDHVVALKEAWDSGAHSWSASKREQFANDLSDERSLIAVKDSENQSKSDKDPSNWLPKNSAYLCTYLADWVAVKARWGLSMDTSEWGRIKNLLTASCKTTTIAPWGSAKSTGTVSTGGSSSTPVGTAAPVVTQAPAAPQSTVAPQPTGGSGAIPTVSPGAWCSPLGGRGTSNGKSYVCSKTNASGVPYSDGRARWRQG